MRSSTGAHYIALDHVRALAAFMVFAWHFTHGANGHPIPFEYVPEVFPLAVFDEGHTGVALFMTLSGYLFAKLLDGKSISYPAFIWNRALRLLPLLALVILVVGIINAGEEGGVRTYLHNVAAGILYPTLPNGGWSITVEFHYYLVLPLFLVMLRRSRWLPALIIVAAIVLRVVIYLHKGQVQSLAYWTIVGRIDQFAFGMLVFQFRGWFAHRHVIALGTVAGFMLIYWYFDRLGGFYLMPSYPSPSALWIFLPTIEAVGYGVGIAWYESSFSHSTNGISTFIARVGEYSYSIYLLHFFVVFRAARFVNEHVMDISNFYVAIAWAMVFFLLMFPVGYLSFRYVEQPFLRLRKRYIIESNNSAGAHRAPAS